MGMSTNKLGWILVHRKVEPGQMTGPKEFVNEDELLGWLKKVWESDRLWHWKRSRPLRDGGPYTILFALGGKVWGDARAETTRRISPKVRRKDFNFAFRFRDRPHMLPKTNPVDLEFLVGLGLTHHHRDLIVLRKEMLEKYKKHKGT